MRFIFVHGTGVRRKRYDQLSTLITTALAKRFPDASFVPCYWGGTHGAALGAGGRSIPGVDGTRAADGGPVAGPLDQEAAEWLLLLTDPLCELRVLAELPEDEDSGLGMPGVRSAGEMVAGLLTALSTELPSTGLLSAQLPPTESAAPESAAAELPSSDEPGTAPRWTTCRAAHHQLAIRKPRPGRPGTDRALRPRITAGGPRTRSCPRRPGTRTTSRTWNGTPRSTAG
ncbi:hypothetical protein [Streptomyces odonnellii]|uniref:hypothetical protein n=1 Tax=Streptomyces odonnellii TaxID=1417980 RepID=UPI000ADCC313|nr:hypothetical protein [Streptomyces odonnellii]